MTSISRPPAQMSAVINKRLVCYTQPVWAQCRLYEMQGNASAVDDRPHIESTNGPAAITDLQTLCESLNAQIADFLERELSSPLLKRVQEQTKTCLGVCEEALERYSLEQLSLSYNGGKDCLVLLICFLAALHTYHASRETEPRHQSPSRSASTKQPRRHTWRFPSKLQSVYIQPTHPFEAVDAFVEASSKYYHLTLTSSTLPMKEAFGHYLDTNPKVDAIFVGTRRTDPHGQSLTHFDETDRGWPKFMRIHPVIDWRYQEIWAFLRHLHIPYCPLYDLGYTSLGGTADTLPNPALLKSSADATMDRANAQYRPAFELVQDHEERLGRQ